ncbi:hypothetical protein ACS0TY_026326 [Phlomoides rotata]
MILKTCRRKAELLLIVEEIIYEIIFMLCLLLNRYRNKRHFRISNVHDLRTYKMTDRIPKQIEHMNDLIGINDSDCLDNLRMNYSTFNHLCYLLIQYVSVGEQVALFLSVLSHHTKTIHKHFHTVLKVVLSLHDILLAKPTPVDEECTHHRCKHFKMVNYNLHEWGNGPSMPQNYKEYFNMNHAKAINVIEQAFGLLKKWWAIMRSPSFYPIKILNIIILSCALLHNFIRDEMPNDPLNEDLRSVTLNQSDDEKFIDSIQPSQAWSDWRDNLAHDMYNNWRRGGLTDQVLAKLRNHNDKRMGGWSSREEHVLAEVMKKIVREGWRSDNGFKTCYLNLLSGHMKQVFPNTDIKPEPHITSHITLWKKNFHSLFEILKHTDVGLDSTTKMKDLKALLMRHKSCPLYDDWCEIFGYSRAPSQCTEDHTSSGRKRKAPTTPDPFVSVVQNLCEGALSRLGDIAQRIGYDQDMLLARKQIYSSISTMHILTLQEKLRAITMITRNTEYIDVLFSLYESDRLERVRMLRQLYDLLKVILVFGDNLMKDFIVLHNMVSEMTYALANIFSSLFSQGFGTTEDHENDSMKEATQEVSGTGMGEGAGLNDVSDQIEDEDQLLRTSEKPNEEHDDGSEMPSKTEKGIEMEEDFKAAAFDISEGSEDDENDGNEDEQIETAIVVQRFYDRG